MLERQKAVCLQVTRKKLVSYFLIFWRIFKVIIWFFFFHKMQKALRRAWLIVP
jgi:hypothetical protein